MSIAKLTFFNKIFYQVVIFGIEANYLVRLQKKCPRAGGLPHLGAEVL